ncbi:3-oxoadipate enol-lactonase [Agrobacterium pusense]|uniref:3-oxoadipate enol-lactonase n=1 Tax=Agrobacterium pusense TaxID=648995 RepID=UPI0010BF2A94|nr:3-oxoadipate enol-lactonase [Agrobacterium pusense]MDH0114437.1 3-oxoadipate enol-lactonase [Agrobacterium pusense]QCL85960.1 3-oxoadipate enol-lactonase [Agrobacterium pusense]
MHFLRCGETAIHYRVKGLDSGKPVIAFINSLGTDFRIWDAVTEVLGDDYAYVLHDKRGHGLSDIGCPPYSIDDHAGDLIALLDHLGVKSAVIWGLSVGGLIAQGLYARRPDLVGALVLSNTAHKIGTADMWNARIDKISAGGLGSLVDPVMERWFTPAFRTPDNAAYAGARNMLSQQPEAGYSGTCAAIRDADFTAAAGRIAVPTLCVVGDQDGSTPPELVKSLADLIPASRFVTIAGCGHIPCLEQPLAYAQAACIFLKTLPEH